MVRLLVAKPSGFCAGVERAINTLNMLLDKHNCVFVNHEIVHNKIVIDEFKKRGVIFTEDIESIPNESIIVLSAHGSHAKVIEIAKQKNLKIVDAICPLVSSVHDACKKLESMGNSIVLIGHNNHPEVIGTVSQVSCEIAVVEEPKDIKKLTIKNPNKVGYVTQTTFDVNDAMEMIKLLYLKFPKITSHTKTNICYATKNRQEIVSQIVDIVDVMLIIGSTNSSNSNRLRDIGDKCKRGSYLIDSEKDIDPIWLDGVEKIGLSAGASAPSNIIKDVIDFLTVKYNAVVETLEGREEKIKFSLPDIINLK